jgi:hypothetical protein
VKPPYFAKLQVAAVTRALAERVSLRITLLGCVRAGVALSLPGCASVGEDLRGYYRFLYETLGFGEGGLHLGGSVPDDKAITPHDHVSSEQLVV